MAAQEATDSIVIDAPPDVVCEAVLDVESQPVWVSNIREVEVRERDDEGQATLVAFRSSAFGIRVRYTLRYDVSRLPAVYSWTMVEGDFRALDGEYRFQCEDGGRTRVTYHLAVEFGFPLPGFVRRRAEHLVMSLALKELKAYVES
jgi:ribosome-associated toxin RatA of RatAB toxin-antitoxin module